MPRHNAAEAMPMPEPQEEQEKDIEELPSDLLKEMPPALPRGEEPTNDTKAALEDLRQISIQRDMEAAAQERKKILETRDAAATERMKRNMGASVLQELPPEDVVMEGQENWVPPAGGIKDNREYMPASPPPIPKDAKKPSLLKRIGKWFRG
jgi:hypothetical protein